MSDERNSLPVNGHGSIDAMLCYIDPASDSETEKFVAAVYADRRAEVSWLT